jgi:S1-C subfamily serine protease
MQTSPMRGVQIDDLTGDIRQHGLRSDVKRVVITGVPESSPAADARLAARRPTAATTSTDLKFDVPNGPLGILTAF